MKVSELGEFGLIDLLAKTVNKSRENQTSWQQLIIGIGDDAAAWQSKTAIQLATTDSLIQDVHFSLAWADWNSLGWKALAISLSDIAAMGGMPEYALVTLALPANSEVEDVTALYQGMIEPAQQSGVAIVGGDVDRAPLIVITTTVLGNASDREHILTRFAARPGEKIAVTGYLGAAAAGLKTLTEKLQLDPEAASYLKRDFLRPNPRIAEGQLLVERGVKTAIDISDGLISDLNHICQSSQVGARLEIHRLPIAPEVKANFGENSLELALSGGEDYELLFTASAEAIDKIKGAASCPITIIGEVTDDKSGTINLVDSQGNPFRPAKGGWDHFTAE
ncbi:thiamine-phosphate kinase [Chloroflexota bacterium]